MDAAAGGEILAAIVWFVMGDLVVAFVAWGIIAIFTGLAAVTNRDWLVVVGFVLGILGGLGALVAVWWNIANHIYLFGQMVWGW